MRAAVYLHGEAIGVAEHDPPGGLAEYVCAPEHTLHRLPDDLGPAAAGLSEPMAVCVRGARIGRIR